MFDQTVTFKHLALIKHQHTSMACPLSLKSHAAIILEMHVVDQDSAILKNSLGRPQAIQDLLTSCTPINNKALVFADRGGLNLPSGYATAQTSS